MNAQPQRGNPSRKGRQSMTDVFNRDMLEILPFGIGYLKPLVNSRNEAEDYTFIEINAFF